MHALACVRVCLRVFVCACMKSIGLIGGKGRSCKGTSLFLTIFNPNARPCPCGVTPNRADERPPSARRHHHTPHNSCHHSQGASYHSVPGCCTRRSCLLTPLIHTATPFLYRPSIASSKMTSERAASVWARRVELLRGDHPTVYFLDMSMVGFEPGTPCCVPESKKRGCVWLVAPKRESRDNTCVPDMRWMHIEHLDGIPTLSQSPVSASWRMRNFLKLYKKTLCIHPGVPPQRIQRFTSGLTGGTLIQYDRVTILVPHV